MSAMRALGCAAATLALSGCALVLGIEEQIYEGAGGATTGSGGATGSGGTAMGSGGTTGSGGATTGSGGAGGTSTLTNSGGAGGVGGTSTSAGGSGGVGGVGGTSTSTGGSGGSGGSGGAGGTPTSSGGSGGGGGAGGSECSGATCSLPNATGMCTAGVCTINECASHYGNCDNDDANGCEAALWTDPGHCGTCDTTCSGDKSSCVLGACSISCPMDRADCDGLAGNGCEVPFLTDISNCGGCGVKCPSGASCSSGQCNAPSCVGGAEGQNDCGPNSESCCTSLLVPGGTVELDASHTATVSAFKLDKYEVTVGRFRKFVDAWVKGWRPAAGSGKHTHLNDGKGLSDGGSGFEPGWDTSWSTNFKATKAEWDTALSCHSTYQTWTSDAGVNEKRPINCVSWAELYAFCIWDGGFLPSEAEWQYAAAGGGENRQYPWSDPPSSTTIDCTYANYDNNPSCVGTTSNVGSTSPKGDGRWGHSDLAGNVRERTLDYYESPYPLSTSTDYVNMSTAADRVLRGGYFGGGSSSLRAAARNYLYTSTRSVSVGARCLRAP